MTFSSHLSSLHIDQLPVSAVCLCHCKKFSPVKAKSSINLWAHTYILQDILINRTCPFSKTTLVTPQTRAYNLLHHGLQFIVLDVEQASKSMRKCLLTSIPVSTSITFGQQHSMQVTEDLVAVLLQQPLCSRKETLLLVLTLFLNCPLTRTLVSSAIGLTVQFWWKTNSSGSLPVTCIFNEYTFLVY